MSETTGYAGVNKRGIAEQCLVSEQDSVAD
jgi:hypothetical protein